MNFLNYTMRIWINMEKINWNILSSNQSAIHLLKTNQDKINWKLLSDNPSAIETMLIDSFNL